MTFQMALSYYKKSTAALIRNAKNRPKVHLVTLFSLDIFDMQVEKAAVFLTKFST